MFKCILTDLVNNPSAVKGDNAYLINASNISSRQIQSNLKQFKNNKSILMLDSSGHLMYKGIQPYVQSNGTIFDENKENVIINGKLNMTLNNMLKAINTITPNMVCISDVPPPNNASDEYFNYLQDVNFQLAEKMIPSIRSKFPDITLLAPVHARNLNEFQKYNEKIFKLTPDGIAFPARQVYIDKIVDYLLALKDRNIETVHLLGAGSLRLLSVMAYLHYKKVFKNITCDYSAHSATRYMQYISPYTLKQISYKDTKYKVLDVVPNCFCGYCIKLYPSYNKENYKDSTILYYHNLSVMGNITGFLNQLIKEHNIETYIDYVSDTILTEKGQYRYRKAFDKVIEACA